MSAVVAALNTIAICGVLPFALGAIFAAAIV